jgi:hypothetical protein
MLLCVRYIFVINLRFQPEHRKVWLGTQKTKYVLPITFSVGLYNSQRKQKLFFLNNVGELMFVMVKCGVLFEVWTEYLHII